LFKVGFHEAMAFRRRQALQGRTLKKYTAQKHVTRSDLLAASPTSHDELVRLEDVVKLKDLLAELPPDQQHVVRQRMYEEKTFAVIAQELNVPIGTVLTRMRLAMEKLQKWWGRDSRK
jgi:RNA polymerase sigma-70 factor (ECF subfamily)